jgi:hypothetical protein
MRNLCLLLVLTNLGVAAWSAWYATPAPGRALTEDPSVPSITLVSELEAAALEAVEALSLTTTEPEEPAPLPPAVAGPVTTERCISVGPFQELAQAAAAQSALRSAGFTPSQRIGDGDIWVGYWVHLSGIPTRAAADEILEQLRANGLSDSYVVPGGEETHTISLGVFSEIRRAASVREQARSLGYDPTVSDRSRRATLYWIDVLADDPDAIELDVLQPPGRINRLEQRPCATVGR